MFIEWNIVKYLNKLQLKGIKKDNTELYIYLYRVSKQAKQKFDITSQDSDCPRVKWKVMIRKSSLWTSEVLAMLGFLIC